MVAWGRRDEDDRKQNAVIPLHVKLLDDDTLLWGLYSQLVHGSPRNNRSMNSFPLLAT
jgi:hypothetical protein